MIRFLFDEDFDHTVVRGLRRRRPDIDAPRVQELGLSGSEDSAILEFAATQRRLVVTHDANTLVNYATDRVAAGRPMPGVIVVRQGKSRIRTIEDLIIVADVLIDGEWEGQVWYLPFR